MSIATQISRIQQAKEDIKASLEALGCPIPSSATVDQYSSYIDCIDGYYIKPSPQPLTFVALENGTFKFSGKYINYSLDSGETWVELASNTNSPTVSAGNKIMWKATLNTNEEGIGCFSSSGRFDAEGNVMSLLYGNDFKTKGNLVGKTNAFRYLFDECGTIVNANEMVLPAMALSDNCYQSMFRDCTSLTTAPELPATTLTSNCYRSMFNGCTSLTTVPALPATTLTNNCYNSMFYGCTSLTTALELPATTLADSCYRSMFQGCTSLTTAPALPATTLTDYCYEYMFKGCTSLTTAPVLPATTLADYCYYSMFEGCTSLTTAPALPATTLDYDCYQYMFRDCANLNRITCLATDISASNCTTNWVQGVASSGTFIKAPSMTGWTTGANGIPSGWDVIDLPEISYLTFKALGSGTFKFSGNSINYSLDNGNTWTALASNTNSPTVSAGSKIMWKATLTPTSDVGIGRFSSTANFKAEGNLMSLLYGDNFIGQTDLTGKDYAFCNLFDGCTTLISAENVSLPATTLAYRCYLGMFHGCTSLTTAPALPATTLVNNCYVGMFQGCTSLTTAPELPATTLSNFCYSNMFERCTSLTTAPELPATTLADSCYIGMFFGCTSLTTAPALPATTLVNDCYYGMFYGCSQLNYIKAMFTTEPSASYMNNWVNGVASSGTFVKNKIAKWTSSCGVSTYPCNWTVETAAS